MNVILVIRVCTFKFIVYIIEAYCATKDITVFLHLYEYFDGGNNAA